MVVLNGTQSYDTDNLAAILTINLSQSLSIKRSQVKLGFCADKLLTCLSG